MRQLKTIMWTVTALFLITGRAHAQDSTQDADKQIKMFLSGQESDDEKAWTADIDAKWAKFTKSVDGQWDTFLKSTNKEWVDYSGDGSTRSIVDFKEGKVVLESVVDQDTAAPDVVAEEKLVKQVKKIYLKQTQEEEYILDGQVEVKGKVLTHTNFESSLKIILMKVKKSKQVIVAKDGKKKIKYTIKLDMVKDHIKKRAKKFKKTIELACTKFQLDPALVMAIIHTESYFNPLAHSGADAVGLMQIVPASGGIDAYYYLFGKKKKPTVKSLYNPKFNIFMGCALLRGLKDNYFKSFKDGKKDLAQEYLVIASYNMGVGNTSKFIRKKKLKGKTADQIYDAIVDHGPYEEVQGYLKKVVTRKTYYRKVLY